MNNFVGDGEMLHHVLTATAASGDAVVMVSKAGFAVTDGAIGDKIAIRMVGNSNIPLKTGGSAMPAGTIVNLDVATGEAYGGAATTGDIANFGYVAEDDSVETDSFVCIKLTDHMQTIAP